MIRISLTRNGNPSPYVSRFSAYTTSLPTCLDFYTWLQQDSLADFLVGSPQSPHASTHGAIGSIYGCDTLDSLTEAGIILDATAQASLCMKWGFRLKELYRQNRLTTWAECSYSTNDAGLITDTNCGVTCSDEDGMMSTLLPKALGEEYLADNLTDSQLETIRVFMCDGDAFKIYMGDHIESASPVDPSFWSIHPSLERTMHAKILAGSFTDLTWANNPKLDYVCDKSSCYEDGVLSAWDECCVGHFENSQFPDFVSGDKTAGIGLTNRQILSQGNPSSSKYSLPYIYSNLEWSHCTQDFDALFTTLYLNGNSYSDSEGN